MASADIGIEVTYAEPHRAIVKTYRLVLPATIDDALRLAAADHTTVALLSGRSAMPADGQGLDAARRRDVGNPEPAQGGT